jgi:F-type H+-transporting ATPase subunit a
MNATRRGAVIILIVIAFLVACAVVTFVVMPGAGIAVGLPVITVPGEAYNGALPSQDFQITNTLVATLLADVMVLIFVFFAWRSSKGWKREVPARFQALAEMIGEFMYNFTKNFAGTSTLARKWLFPLAATIFVFLLAANWMKLFPGVETVGVLHCAHAGFSGYPSQQVGYEAYQLHVSQPLYAGEPATEETYHDCEHFKENIDELKPSKTALEEAATALQARIAAIEAETPAGDPERAALVRAAQLEAVDELYHGATIPLNPDQIRAGVIPYVQVVTPFVRGPATDLNLTIGLALVVVVAIQIFGVASLGPDYFQKFINLRALGNAGKKPLGVVDFLVGIFEIVSELGKIISLAFRLFGNMFAGGILLAVMSFLVAFFLPIIFYGLEVIVTTIQAFVFAVLTLVFVGQAMAGHHGDEGHDDHGHHDEAAAGQPHAEHS